MGSRAEPKTDMEHSDLKMWPMAIADLILETWKSCTLCKPYCHPNTTNGLFGGLVEGIFS